MAARIEATDSVAIIGPGPVRDRLDREVRGADARRHVVRDVAAAASPRLTDRQLIARLRVLAGDVPRRRTVGAYRWTAEPAVKASGAAIVEPERVIRKPVRDRPRMAQLLSELDELLDDDGAQDLENQAATRTFPGGVHLTSYRTRR